jgi:hypothetical protein
MKKENGFSSVEVLIASAITLCVMAGVMGSLNSSMVLSRKVNQTTDMEQNLRAGINFMVRDLLAAGCGIPTGGIPVPSGTGVNIFRPGPQLQNYTFPASTLSLVGVTPGPNLGDEWEGQPTDLVNILYADNVLLLNDHPITTITRDSQKVSITINNATPITGINNPVKTGDLIMLTNAKGSTLVCVTSVAGQVINFATGGDVFHLNQHNALAGSVRAIDNDDDESDGVIVTGFPSTSATRVYMITFFLDFATNPDMPRLVRRVNSDPGRPIALVLDNLQLTYDLVDGVTNPTNVDIPTGTNTNQQIRKANLMLSGRSSAPMLETGDYFRKTMTTQVSFRSMSFVDRYRSGQ